MVDNREALKNGYEFYFNKEHKYIVINEIGRGASCIVYNAGYVDNVGIFHNVRIKECYPVHLRIQRSDDGSLDCLCSQTELFQNKKNQFFHAYERNVEIGNILGLVNSTTDAVNMYEYNNTWYSVYTFVEGIDFKQKIDADLKSLFTRMIVLAKIVQKYHKINMLHLDIKPENILVIPETKEYLILFDFDSLLSIDQLKSDDEIYMSFSDGFSAPELVQGRRNKIGKETDIYSIGAIVFYKIFGKTPNRMDGSIGAVYDYSKMNYADMRYQPVFYRKLDEFFHKTISASIAHRYNDLSVMTEDLAELENLSDLEGVYLCGNFVYHSSGFVGRRHILLELQEGFEKTNVIFLHGIGGIGKTEIAKRFAFEKRKDFNRILFIPFVHTIKETVCGDEFRIHNFDRECEETEDSYFVRKINVLKDLVREEDFIILDNFDIEMDDDLEILLGLECKFLITTREDFSDFGYKQIEVKEIEDIWELTCIFENYNKNEYIDEERESVIDIIEYVERHTMTVDLIAKYIRKSGQLPSEFLREMMGKEGITNTSDIRIKHRKDRRLCAQSINFHLVTLFHLFDFDADECELIMSLSLFGAVRITRDSFLQLYHTPWAERRLDGLIRSGWIEEDKENNKISLHQIILDLVYNHLKPDVENCFTITRGMINYFREKETSNIKKQNKKRLAKYFIERVNGEGDILAELYLAFFQNIQKDEAILIRADELCNANISNINIELDASIQLARLEQLSRNYDWWMIEDFEAIFDEIYEKVVQYELKLFALLNIPVSISGLEIGDSYVYDRCHKKCHQEKNKKSIDDNSLKLYLKIADTLEKLASSICNQCFEAEEGGYRGIQNIFLDAEKVLQYTLYLTGNDGISFETKERIYKFAITFYSKDDYCNMARCDFLGDMEKSAFYSEQLNNLRTAKDENDIRLYLDETTYMEAANQAMIDGKYSNAILLCEKALKRGESVEDDILYWMSDSYMKMGNYDKVEKYLNRIMDYDIERQLNLCYTRLKLVELYEQTNRRKKAIAYCNDMICELRESASVENIDDIIMLMRCFVKKTKLEDKTILDDLMAEEIASYFSILDKQERIDTDLLDVCIMYFDYLHAKGNMQTALEFIFHFAERFRIQYDNSEASKLYSKIVNEQDFMNIDTECYVKAMLYKARTWLEGDGKEDIDTVLALCDVAKKLINANKNISDYDFLIALLYKIKADIYLHSPDYSCEQLEEARRNCDYYLLTKRAIENRECMGSEYDEWRQCLYDSLEIENYEMSLKCLQRMHDELQKDGAIRGDEAKIKVMYANYYSEYLKYGEKKGDWVNVIDYANKIFKLLYDLRQIEKEENSQKFYNRFEEIAKALEQADYMESSVYIRLLEIFEICSPVAFNKYYKKDCLLKEKYIRNVFDKVQNDFPKYLENKTMDLVIESMDKIVVCSNKNEKLYTIGTFCKHISEKYKHSQIEFKR